MTQTVLLRTAFAAALLATSTLASAQAGGSASSASAAAVVSANAPVRTQQGMVQGAPGKVEGVTVFKNIPFAAPPVGELRWRPPQPPASWSAPRDASRLGAICVQPPANGDNGVGPLPMSEYVVRTT